MQRTSAVGTYLLGRKHMLLHKVLDLLENSSAFSGLKEQTF